VRGLGSPIAWDLIGELRCASFTRLSHICGLWIQYVSIQVWMRERHVCCLVFVCMCTSKLLFHTLYFSLCVVPSLVLLYVTCFPIPYTPRNTMVPHAPIFLQTTIQVSHTCLVCNNTDTCITRNLDYKYFLGHVWTLMFITPSAMRAWYCEPKNYVRVLRGQVR